jgi:hypothetical protein
MFLMCDNSMSEAKNSSCRNCRKPFIAKNTLFCSTSCYKFYTNALNQNIIPSLENNANQTEKLNNFTILNGGQINCVHEYSKNGTMSCRKCGYMSVLHN